MTTKQAFMAAVRGIDTHHVVKALNSLTPGTNWAKCSKGLMSDEYRMAFGPYGSPRLKRIDLEQLKRRAQARADGNRDWMNL
jgi:hypothetical protein